MPNKVASNTDYKTGVPKNRRNDTAEKLTTSAKETRDIIRSISCSESPLGLNNQANGIAARGIIIKIDIMNTALISAERINASKKNIFFLKNISQMRIAHNGKIKINKNLDNFSDFCS